MLSLYRVVLIAALVLVTGCVAAWGNGYKLTPGPIETLTTGPAERVLIEYDPVWIRVRRN